MFLSILYSEKHIILFFFYALWFHICRVWRLPGDCGMTLTKHVLVEGSHPTYRSRYSEIFVWSRSRSPKALKWREKGITTSEEGTYILIIRHLNQMFLAILSNTIWLFWSTLYTVFFITIILLLLCVGIEFHICRVWRLPGDCGMTLTKHVLVEGSHPTYRSRYSEICVWSLKMPKHWNYKKRALPQVKKEPTDAECGDCMVIVEWREDLHTLWQYTHTLFTCPLSSYDTKEALPWMNSSYIQVQFTQGTFISSLTQLTLRVWLWDEEETWQYTNTSSTCLQKCIEAGKQQAEICGQGGGTPWRVDHAMTITMTMTMERLFSQKKD